MQNKNKFSSAVFGNWVVKVFCFIVALAIVVAVRFLNITDRVVTIPITVYINPQSQYEPVSLVPESVDVVISGDDDIVYLDYDNDIFSSYGLTIKSSPATIRILFQEGNK